MKGTKKFKSAENMQDGSRQRFDQEARIDSQKTGTTKGGKK